MTDIEELAAKIRGLSIKQHQIIEDVMNEISRQGNENTLEDTRQGTEVGPNTGVRLLPRRPNNKFVSSNDVPLSVGDRVKILTTRRIGRSGDLAEVEVFNKLYVGIKLLETGISGQRAAKYLRYIE